MTVDPTAIPIQFDPREQRMTGIAYHGATPFDVPYISQVTDDLWQGGCTDGLVLPAHITSVLSLYPWERYDIQHRFVYRKEVRLYDNVEMPPDEQLVELAEWVNASRKNGPTLVHCQAGLNRSGLVAGLALVLDGMTPEAAIALLREKRSPAVLCNQAFQAWLLAYRAPAPA